jgi:hypothetical protein
MRLLVFVLIIWGLPTADALGRNYYISGKGNDRHSGKSALAAWKTPVPLNRLGLQPGDTVFLERGFQYRGSLIIKNSGRKEAPIVISAHGIGSTPVLMGSTEAKCCKLVSDNVFEQEIGEEVFDVFYKGRRLTPARFPNSGHLTIDQGFGKDSIACAALQQEAGYWNNAVLRIRTIDWVYETRSIRFSEPGLLVQGPQNRYFIDRGFLPRMDSGRTPLYTFQKGYGFFLEGLPSLVDTTWEWSWQNGTLRVQVPDGFKAEDLELEAVTRPYGIWLEAGVAHVKVQGLAFAYQEKAGVGGGWHLKNVVINNNVFSSIHGAGILLDSASENCVIQGNTLTDILGRGISALEPVKLLIEANLILRIGLSRGEGWTGVNGASAIVVYNNERKISDDTTYAHDNTVRYNRIDSCGYIGIRVDGHHNLVEYNVIDHCSLTLNDGANLYCFATKPGITHHSVFRKNIIRYSIGDSEMTPGNPNLAFGIYLDNNSHDILVEGNTVLNTNAAGITNNDASFRNAIRDNTTYNCKEGVGFAEWANPGGVYDCVVEGNTLVGVSSQQNTVNLSNFIGPVFEVGRFDRNVYVNTTATQFFFFQTKQIPAESKLNLAFWQWQRLVDGDRNSTAITGSTPWAMKTKPEIFINDSFSEKEMALPDGVYHLLNGNRAPQKLIIPQLGSVILLKEIQ